MSSQPHRATSAVRWRRPALGLLAGLALASAIIVPSTLATGKAAPADKTTPAGKTAPAGTTSPGDNNCAGAPDPVFPAAVAQLEHAGTIDQAQARAIDAFLYHSCSDDGLKQLVDSGTITAAQAQAVNDAFAHAKMSLATTLRHHRRNAHHK